MADQTREPRRIEDPPTPEEIERRRTWVAKKQADPDFMAKVREAVAALDRGEGVRWEVVADQEMEVPNNNASVPHVDVYLAPEAHAFIERYGSRGAGHANPRGAETDDELTANS